MYLWLDIMLTYIDAGYFELLIIRQNLMLSSIIKSARWQTLQPLIACVVKHYVRKL